MDDRKQYTREVVINIIKFMAQTSAGIKPSEEKIKAIPEEFYTDIMAALIAARVTKEIAMVKTMSSIFPIEELLNKLEEEARED